MQRFCPRGAIPFHQLSWWLGLSAVNEMRAWKQDAELLFTKTEWRLLLLFVQNPNRILSKSQILDALFDAEGDFVEENTVAVMIRRLREKIEDDPARSQYIKNVRGGG